MSVWTDATSALIVGAALAIAMLACALMRDSALPTLAEVRSFVVLAGLALYALGFDPAWSVAGLWQRVGAGLLGVLTLMLPVPGLQGARHSGRRDIWAHGRKGKV
ncbi:hypothetical protein [Variovorax sp. OV329]|uniref:hypothetical protein n=1 Tax=Variovorax sp. OV329 TaxID=1882825 RepID=UPI0008E35358|nr:hypothetical protein [Variovorax sp. OV329]SFM92260.1 hypothetical protein SAMN05444747_11149 [Variovorax sp. OV329]